MRGVTTFGRDEPRDADHRTSHDHDYSDQRDPLIDDLLQSHDNINDALSNDLQYRPMYDRNKAHLFNWEHD